jgi:hypothetical protein
VRAAIERAKIAEIAREASRRFARSCRFGSRLYGCAPWSFAPGGPLRAARSRG